RPKNEDAFVAADLTSHALLGDQPLRRFDVGRRGVLLAVSDGMGGERAGEVASALVVETLTHAMEEPPPFALRVDEFVTAAVEKAHRVVRNLAQTEGHERMGATLTAVFVRGRKAYIAEVGDSRAYLVRGGVITRLTHDQSMVQLLLDTGAIRPEE